MAVFSEEITSLINDYKRVLKRYLSPSDRDEKIAALLIKRRDLRLADDVLLYQKGFTVLTDVKGLMNEAVKDKGPHGFSGLEKFYGRLQAFVKEYHIEGNPHKSKSKVVHAQQRLSRAMLEVIQLLSLPASALHGRRAEQLQDALAYVGKHGDAEQKKQLENVLSEHQKKEQSEKTFSFADVYQGDPQQAFVPSTN